MSEGVTLTEPQARALRLIAEAGPVTLPTARRWLITHATLRSLVRRGILVKHEPAPGAFLVTYEVRP